MTYFEDESFLEVGPDTFENTEFLGCFFENIDATENSFRNSKFLECEFKNCNLSNISTTNSSLRDVKFQNCKIIGVNWSASNILSDLFFEESKLDFCVFQDMKLFGIEFHNSSLSDVDFSQSDLENAQIINCELGGALFNSVRLVNANLSNSYNYNIDPRFTKVKGTKFSAPEVMSLLKAFEIKIE